MESIIMSSTTIFLYKRLDAVEEKDPKTSSMFTNQFLLNVGTWLLGQNTGMGVNNSLHGGLSHGLDF